MALFAKYQFSILRFGFSILNLERTSFNSPYRQFFPQKRIDKTILSVDIQMFTSIVQFSILRFEFSILNHEQVNFNSLYRALNSPKKLKSNGNTKF